MSLKSAIFLIGVSVFLLASPSAKAQEDPDFDFNRAYQDYVFTLNAYNSEHSEYLLAKAQYNQAGTLVSQTKAREETIDMLEARDDVVITYMTAVRMKLVEAEGVTDLTKNGLFTRIDAEIAWFRDHKARIASAGTLADLAKDSEEANEKFNGLTQNIAYEALATVPFGKLSLMRSSANAILDNIDAKLFAIRANGDKDTAIAERWAFEVENKITRSLDKEIEAQAEIPNLTPDDRDRNQNLSGTFNDIIFKLEESRQFLRDATEFMDEIMREIIVK